PRTSPHLTKLSGDSTKFPPPVANCVSANFPFPIARHYNHFMTAAIIEARGLRKSYGNLEALKGIDVTVRAGEVFCLLGPNGAGKTTTRELLEHPTDSDADPRP